MSALRQCDQEQQRRGFPIFQSMAAQKSWVETISRGNSIIRTQSVWNSDDVGVLLGKKTTNENWGLLGNMGVRGNAAKTLENNQHKVRQILHTLFTVSDADEFKRAAVEAMQGLTGIPNFNIGIATRLIALTRPDYAVS
jgi:hypothetical protein